MNQYRRCRHRVETLCTIEKEILKLRNQGLVHNEDTRLWKGIGDSSNRDFSTSQTWQILWVASPIVSWYQGIWFLAATPKFSVIAWLAIRDRLATGERVLRWNPQGDATCVLCNGTMETRDHLFFNLMPLFWSDMAEVNYEAGWCEEHNYLVWATWSGDGQDKG